VAAVAPNANGGASGGKVQFTFNHILSKIGFSAKLAADYGSATTVNVRSLRVYYDVNKVKKDGTYVFASDNTAGAGAWTLGANYFSEQNPGTGDQLFTGNQALSNGHVVDLCNPGAYLMLIPQTLIAGDMYVELTYDQETAVNLVTDMQTATLTVRLPDITWDQGKQYTYNLLVSLTGVTLDNLSVNGWEEGNQPGDVNVP
jgi:hypothetical protein